MGWGQLQAWRRERARSITARQEHSGPIDPDSWAGRERDPWWEQARKRGAR